ncbi:hypothetical protein N9251_02455, partial [Gammaproteobacteria bacterium]|nr:hypothetical protein [Gammaproteobacteria bacterium]
KDSIFEYEQFSTLPTLFSKSNIRISKDSHTKMLTFWLKCAKFSFEVINNPYDFNKELLIEFIKRIHEYTESKENGYYKVLLILYRLGVTVLTQPYVSKTGSFGATMLINNKPCIIITDMQKKYHKLWLSLLHELYHVITDYDILQSTNCHISSEKTPDLLFNEQKADSFAKNAIISQYIQDHLSTIIKFPTKVHYLAKQLNINKSLIYGIYLENITQSKLREKEYRKYGNKEMLCNSDIAIKDIIFDPIQNKNLNTSIRNIQNKMSNQNKITL